MEQESPKKKTKVVRLRCSVQNYDWGIVGKASQVARLCSLNSGSGIVHHPHKPYAEFWVGTHESGPSFVVRSRENGGLVGSESVSLQSWILENPDVLGDKVLKKWGCDLPFLFKVLSVEKALSIQAHPDKKLARALNKSQPSIYRDDNHKPEMALALTEFEALCGFITRKELEGVLCTVPEIVDLIGGADAEEFLHVNEQLGNEKVNAVLASIFTQLMSSSKDAIHDVIFKLKRRLNKEKETRQLTDKEQLVLRLESQYPGDVGVVAAFFLNYVKLNRGEALYLGANEPHAYICGECIECMATSDNVVRAGLTSKHRDTQTLLSMLTYRQVSAAVFPEILRGVPLNLYTTRYLPPFDEFEVDRCILPKAASVVFPAVPGPSLFLFIAGKGMINAGCFEEDVIEEGEVLFVPAYTEISITACINSVTLV
ncbi:hypothetical protein L1049_006080 [Liquidambar formosana]|uniref:mannose-6-phosphate isomerase n=1 Tax=Liquidambar formosana TaxID=63359 RepID=A0AAP0REW5_LIQFO